MTLNIGAFPPWHLPDEKIVETDQFLTVYLHKTRQEQGRQFRGVLRVAKLECGHLIATTNRRHAHCHYCQLIWDAGLDWDRFRHHDRVDPLRGLGEDELEALRELARKNGLDVVLEWELGPKGPVPAVTS